MERVAQGNAAQLDRAQRRGGGGISNCGLRTATTDGAADCERFACSPPGPTRCSARLTWCCRRNTKSWPHITTPEHQKAVADYQAYAAGKSDLERTELAREKTGVFTGAYAVNPVNNEKIPVWIADYVLATYGTGAIMAVPAHDERDLEFARKFDLPVRVVVQAPEGRESIGFVGDGVSVNSGFLTGLPTPEAKKKITAWLEEKELGRKTVNYKLRDWLFSRQRYWGEPFPIVWKPAGHEALPESALPAAAARTDRFQTHRHRRTAAGPREGLGAACPTARPAKPTPCRNGPAVAGITCASPTRPTTAPSAARRRTYWMGHS